MELEPLSLIIKDTIGHNNREMWVIIEFSTKMLYKTCGGLVIQSVEDNKIDIFRENFDKLNKKHKKLMQNLADL